MIFVVVSSRVWPQSATVTNIQNHSTLQKYILLLIWSAAAVYDHRKRSQDSVYIITRSTYLPARRLSKSIWNVVTNLSLRTKPCRYSL